MTFFTVEDADNIQQLLLHHLGHPWPVDGVRLGLLDERAFTALQNDLLSYCTRLRCQPNTAEHTDNQGYRVPKHRLIRD